MTTNIEYNWTRTSNLDKKVPKIHFPKKIALSFLLVDTPTVEEIRLAVVHPKSFGTWMFPYGGQRFFSHNIFSDSKTLSDITDTLDEIIKDPSDELKQDIEKELKLYFKSFNFKKLPQPEFITYSLKFSANSNEWTAYIFLYHRTNIFEWSSKDIENKLLNINTLDKTIRNKSIDGIKIEGNVIEYLKYINS